MRKDFMEVLNVPLQAQSRRMGHTLVVATTSIYGVGVDPEGRAVAQCQDEFFARRDQCAVLI